MYVCETKVSDEGRWVDVHYLPLKTEHIPRLPRDPFGRRLDSSATVPHSLSYSLQLLYLWALGWRKSAAFCSKQRKARPKIERLPDPLLLVKLDVTVCAVAQIQVSEHLGQRFYPLASTWQEQSVEVEPFCCFQRCTQLLLMMWKMCLNPALLLFSVAILQSILGGLE